VPYSLRLIHLNTATLKNDDAADSDGEGEDNDAIATESKALRTETATRLANERQPTGRIVGIIKRNWRA
jgi:exosome complex exonuclease DIS3/RRP44